MWVFVGTYTGAESKGIYRFEFDPATAVLTNRQLAAETPSPSFLAIHPSRKFLYAVGETSDFGGKPSGSVSAFGVDPKTGELTFLNRQSSSGAGPCYLVVDRAGQHVLAANYGGGSACVIATESDGRLGDARGLSSTRGPASTRSARKPRTRIRSTWTPPIALRSWPIWVSTSCLFIGTTRPRER